MVYMNHMGQITDPPIDASISPVAKTTVSTVHYEALIAKRDAYDALKAENERLQAMIADALAIPEADTGYGLADECANDMRDEFRKSLGSAQPARPRHPKARAHER